MRAIGWSWDIYLLIFLQDLPVVNRPSCLKYGSKFDVRVAQGSLCLQQFHREMTPVSFPTHVG